MILEILRKITKRCCPECHAWFPAEKHKPDCLLAQAIAELEECERVAHSLLTNENLMPPVPEVDEWVPVEDGLPEDVEEAIDVIAEIKTRSGKLRRERICDIAWEMTDTYPDSYTFTHYRKITLPKIKE